MILKLDFSSEVPIYLQIRNQVVLGVADGRLKPGERLPTIRALADEAGVNTMTVNKAFALLKSEGVIIADRRSGARVREPENHEGEKAVLSERALAELRLVIAEAKLAGMSSEDFISLCVKEYGELDENVSSCPASGDSGESGENNTEKLSGN